MFYEFFAGGGMARVGLGARWSCSFANDNSALNAAAYRAKWSDGELDEWNIDDVRVEDLPAEAHLAWAGGVSANSFINLVLAATTEERMQNLALVQQVARRPGKIDS